jgi:hypothetical protein
MKLNTKPKHVFTHEGGVACQISSFQQLERTIMSCMLWEDGFYEDGETIANRIKRLVKDCDPNKVADLALKARNEFKLRHAPLLLVRELSRYPSRYSVAGILSQVIQRADELTEFLSIYWKEGKKPLAKQVKKV